MFQHAPLISSRAHCARRRFGELGREFSPGLPFLETWLIVPGGRSRSAPSATSAPLPSPRRSKNVGLGPGRRLNLPQGLELGAVAPEEPHSPYGSSNFHRPVRLLDPMHAEVSRWSSGSRRSAGSFHMTSKGVEPLKARRPPVLRSRAASGTQAYGIGEASRAVVGEDDVEARVGKRTVSAGAWTSGNSRPAAASGARACSSWRSELSTPTGRAPRPASRIDHYAAPQPSSSMSFPATSPENAAARVSGSCHIPQRGSQARPMCSRCVSWYSSRVTVPERAVLLESSDKLRSR